jgi:hypothetical protein
MQDERNDTITDDGSPTEQTILMLLLGGRQSVWSVDELVAEIGRRLDTIDTLDRLRAAGLVHRCGEFAFATRAAIRFDGIRPD